MSSYLLDTTLAYAPDWSDMIRRAATCVDKILRGAQPAERPSVPSWTLPAWGLALLRAPFVGSFIGVLITRLPVGARVVLARSACTSCDHALGVRDLVPVLSWALLRGRCRHCGASIGLFYPGIELAAVLSAAWAALGLPGAVRFPGALPAWAPPASRPPPRRSCWSATCAWSG